MRKYRNEIVILLMLAFLFPTIIIGKRYSSENYYSDNGVPIKIRVATWNIGKLNMGKPGITSISKDSRKDKIREYRDQLNKVRADIFCINEYAPYFSLKDSLAEDKDDLTSSAILPMYSNCNYGERYGANCNCIASAGYDITDFKSVNFKKRKQKRYFSECQLVVSGNIVKIVTTHLDVPKFKIERSAQIQSLLDTYRMERYVIICGDFNVSDTSEFDVFVSHGYQMANHGMLGDIITYPTKNGGHCLDNIMCKGFDIFGIDVYRTELSDHYILACDLIMKKTVNQ